jgi:adenylate cyclase
VSLQQRPDRQKHHPRCGCHLNLPDFGTGWVVPLVASRTLCARRDALPSEKAPTEGREEFWRDFLTRGSPRERASRRIYMRLPHGPRCRICAAPFAGPSAPIMRLIGKRPADNNPNLCSSCFTFMADRHGGAEIELSLLFADIRGSTSLAEGMSSSAYQSLLGRFYDVAADAIFKYDGMLDKFVGDEVVASFAPLLAGERHAERAVEAAKALLRATGHETTAGPWAPLGAGVHTGVAWMGFIGEGPHGSMTVVGDAVNVAARLASVAVAGEILVSTAAARAAGVEEGLPHRQLDLKGKQQRTEVISITVGPQM